MINGLEAECFQ